MAKMIFTDKKFLFLQHNQGVRSIMYGFLVLLLLQLKLLLLMAHILYFYRGSIGFRLFHDLYCPALIWLYLFL